MAPGDLDAPGIVGQRRLLVDVGKNSRRPRFKPDQQPTEAGLIHGVGLRIGEQLGLDEAPQPEVGVQLALRAGDRRHQLDHLRIHVELVVVQHEAVDAIGLVEVDHLLDDRLCRAHPDAPERG
jgi:hypothetical protein